MGIGWFELLLSPIAVKSTCDRRVVSEMNSTDREQYLFVDLGYQYYVAGRFSVAAGHVPVSANLLHHAIEMFLKAALARDHTSEQLRQWNHDIVALWDEWKRKTGDANLGAFDATVRTLHAFEHLRYPDAMMARGAQIIIGFGAPGTVGGSAADTVPSYKLNVEDIDGLVDKLLDAIGINKRIFSDRANPHAKQYFLHQRARPWT